ncbi:hypothetical protein E2C01_048239 [Portunus trituberculatus]|uniref:Uncharacterized protein n=1 Tax=Portunus trituberculatus TaxID=210409 RepID=A0A5B7GA27_PORTR|nr:hypothetical protein [Portunus trituberculatus]
MSNQTLPDAPPRLPVRSDGALPWWTTAPQALPRVKKQMLHLVPCLRSSTRRAFLGGQGCHALSLQGTGAAGLKESRKGEGERQRGAVGLARGGRAGAGPLAGRGSVAKCVIRLRQ